MMFYNWKGIKHAAKGNCIDCIRLLNLITFKMQPRNIRDNKLLSSIKYTTLPNVILDMKGLLSDTSSTDNDKCVYLELLSLLNNFDRATKGTYHIPTYYVKATNISLDALEMNPLIIIKDENIYFTY